MSGAATTEDDGRIQLLVSLRCIRLSRKASFVRWWSLPVFATLRTEPSRDPAQTEASKSGAASSSWEHPWMCVQP